MPRTLNISPNFRLKEIEQADQDDLRTWKNTHKMSFFFQQDITPEMQAGWFAKYQARNAENTDHMFMVQERDATTGTLVNIGCMGFRDEGNSIDIYNLMRGQRLESDSGHTMSDALNAMLACAQTTYPGKPVTCMVLQNNPARGWYEANGFDLTGEHPSYKDDTSLAYVTYQLNPERFNPVAYQQAA